MEKLSIRSLDIVWPLPKYTDESYRYSKCHKVLTSPARLRKNFACLSLSRSLNTLVFVRARFMGFLVTSDTVIIYRQHAIASLYFCCDCVEMSSALEHRVQNLTNNKAGWCGPKK